MSPCQFDEEIFNEMEINIEFDGCLICDKSPFFLKFIKQLNFDRSSFF